MGSHRCSNDDIASVIGSPLTLQTTRNSTFCIAFHIFVVGEGRDYKFDVQVDHSNSQLTDDKLFLKGTWSHHVTHFKFLIPPPKKNIYGTALTRDFKFCTVVGHVKY